MKSVDQWLDEYGESHKNATNKAIHWVCIPVIMFSILGLLWVIPVPAAFEAALPYNLLNWGSIAMVLALLFYIRLSLPLFFGFVVVVAALIAGNAALYQAVGENGLTHLLVNVGIFVIAWIFQFIGHNIEGKKPSFFKDLQFLLIGPAWLMHFIYKKLGIPYKLS